MAEIVADRVAESTTTTGTGAYTLAGALTGFRACSAVCANGDIFYGFVDSATEWEVGTYTWNTGGVLSRTKVRASSNAGVEVNWGAGTKRVTMGLTAAQLILLLSGDITAGFKLAGSAYLRQASMTVSPGAASTALYITNYAEVVYSDARDLPTPAHVIGAMGKAILSATGRTIGLAIGSEGTIEVASGTAVTLAAPGVFTLNANSGTITEFVGVMSQITANAGTVNTFVGLRAYVPQNSGTIGDIVGLDVPDMGALAGVTGNRFAVRNRDQKSVIFSAGSVIDSSRQGPPSMASGGTTTLERGKTFVLLAPSAQLASHTLAYPADALDGQRLTFLCYGFGITSLTHTGGTFFEAPTSLTKGQTFTMQKMDAYGGWVKVMS